MAWNIIYAPPLLNYGITATKGVLGLSGFAPNVGNSGLSTTIAPHTTPLNFAGSQAIVAFNTFNIVGETLPSATIGVAYTQNISGQASGGTLPYTFTLLSSTGPDSWTVSSAGVISGTPITAMLVTDVGNFLVDQSGNNLSE